MGEPAFAVGVAEGGGGEGGAGLIPSESAALDAGTGGVILDLEMPGAGGLKHRPLLQQIVELRAEHRAGALIDQLAIFEKR